MLIPDQGNLVIKSGTKSTSEYTIKASAKAFDILSSGLYSDKIKAIIRELSTNAFDAHVDANNADTPFYVHLPTEAEPSFWIRDFGTGMSKEQIENLYTTYFDSTKTSSNDFVGCLGLGSKSPFSYIDNFSVISFFGGTKYTYTCFISEQGTPAIALLEECKTEQENGLMISISVKRQDISEFHTKAKEVYRFFSCPISFNVDLQIERFDSEKHYKKLFVSSNSTKGLTYIASKSVSSLARGRKIFAVMGNVCYPVDTSMIINSFQSGSIFNNGFFTKYVATDIFICCPIGSVDVAASRESLQYKKQTCLFLANCLEEFSDICKDTIKEQISDKTLIEQRETIEGLSKMVGYDFFLEKILENLADPNVAELNPRFDFDFQIINLQRSFRSEKTIKFSKPTVHKKQTGKEDVFYYRNVFSFDLYRHYFCFVKPDEDDALKAYEKRFLTETVLSDEYSKKITLPHVVIFSSKSDFESFKKAYPGPKSRVAFMDVQKPLKTRSKIAKEHDNEIVVAYNVFGHATKQTIKNLANKDLFIKNNNMFFVGEKCFNVTDVKAFISLLGHFSCKVEEQYCFVSGTIFEKLKKINKNIISANQQVENIINSASQKQLEECLLFNCFTNANYIHNCFKSFPQEIYNVNTKDNKLNDLLRSIIYIEQKNMFVSKNFKFAYLFLPNYEDENNKIYNELKNVFSKYSDLQNFISGCATRNMAKFIATYINGLN